MMLPMMLMQCGFIKEFLIFLFFFGDECCCLWMHEWMLLVYL